MSLTNLRPDVAQHLAQRLRAFSEGFRQNLAILGPPGSGKTYQLQQLLAQPPAKLLVVYCPLYRDSSRSFLQRFLCAVLQAGLPSAETAPSGGAAQAATQPELTRLLSQADSLLPRTAAAVRTAESLIARRLYGEAFTRALDAIPVLIEERRQSCVLILDEFLFLETLGFAHAFHELGKRVMTWPAVLFIFTSSAEYRARSILRERLQLLFGQFELLTLDALDAETVTGWVHQQLRGVRKASAASPFLISWLGLYPWYLTVVLKRLRELAMLSKTPELTEPLFLQTVWDLLGSPQGTLHHWCVSRTEALSHGRLGSRGLEALLHIAQGARTTTELSRRIGRATLSGALQLLVEEGLAQRNGMCWVVPDPILRCWLSTALMEQWAGSRPDSPEVRARFEQHLRALWTRWMQARQLSFPEQVVELFGKFQDDTVSLDSKTGRLPKFATVATQRAGEGSTVAYLIAEGEGRRWCATIQEHQVTEQDITHFDAFCRTQSPKPSRKVVITKTSVEPNAKLLAKAVNMWVWDADALNALTHLYMP